MTNQHVEGRTIQHDEKPKRSLTRDGNVRWHFTESRSALHIIGHSRTFYCACSRVVHDADEHEVDQKDTRTGLTVKFIHSLLQILMQSQVGAVTA